MDLKNYSDDAGRIRLPQNNVQKWVLVNTAISIRVPYTAGKF
jgi:hypothetical protein